LVRGTVAVVATVLCAAAVTTGASGSVLPTGRAAPTDVATTAMGAPSALVMVVRRAPQCASVRETSATTIVVPVVVDLGGTSDHAQVSCVSVPTGSNGAQVLAARAKLLGTTGPRYAVSGLLCAIDGYPAPPTCGQQNGSHYAYWAYFHGGTSWTYSNVGPASWPVSPGDVEGWRFEPDGSATPADPPPRSPSDAPTLCPSSGPPTTTTSTPSSPPTTGAPSSTVPSGSRPPVDPGRSGVSPSSPTTKPVLTTPHGKGPGSTGASTTPSNPGPASSTSAPTGGVTRAIGSGTDASGARRATRLASAPEPGHGGAPIGLIVAVALIVLLAVAAVIRTRRSTRVQ
jgi:hypothetical protein